MGRYIKKHREQFTWVLLPLMALVILGSVSISVFPGWIRPAFSTLGANCADVSTNSNDPLISACDPCAGEFCNSVSGLSSVCAQDYNRQSFVQCQCTTTLTSLVNDQTFFFITTSFGGFNDDFCQDISGGDTDNVCRTATCTVDTTYNPDNPTGCTFLFDDDNAACINCEDTPASENCGNGICEDGIGETFDSCPVDCKVPGFPLDEPLPAGDPILNSACAQPAALPTITFGGNIEASGSCEDGDVCTENVCVPVVGAVPVCEISPAECGGNESDLCCPSGCNPAPDGAGTCNLELDPNCDVDCLPPQDCDPTPSPIPPINITELSGTSLVCSLSDRGPGQGWKGSLSLASLAVGLSALLIARKRRTE